MHEQAEDRTGVNLERMPAAADEIASARARLQLDPRHGPSYQTLRAALTSQGRYDAAWCVCATMSYLGCASSRENLYYRTYAPRRAGRGAKLNRALWQRIVEPSLDPRMGLIAEAIGFDLAIAHARPLRHYGLIRKSRRDTRGDQLALSRALERAVTLLGVDLPDLYLEPDLPGELALANAVHRGQLAPSLVARADVLRGRTPSELDCLAGCALTYLLRDLYLRVVFPTEVELRTSWVEIRDLAGSPRAGRRAGSKSGLGTVRPKLERSLSARGRAALARAVHDAGFDFDDFDVVVWARAVDATAQRIGLVLCGDPAVALRTLARDSAPARAANLDQLLGYSVSDDYFAVRAQLDQTIDAAESSEMRAAA